MAGAIDMHGGTKSPLGMLSSVMTSQPQVLIGMYLMIGLDDIGLLCMLLGLLGIHSAGLFGSFRARWEGSKAPKDKRSQSSEEGAKVFKDKPSAAPKPPHVSLVGLAILLAIWRLVGPTLGLLDTPIIADVSFVLLIAIAYFQCGATTSKSEFAVLPIATKGQRSTVKQRQPKPPSATKSVQAAIPPAAGLAGEIERFVNNALPRQQDSALLRKLTSKAKGCIRKVVPEAEVTTTTYVNLRVEATEEEIHDSDCYMVVTCDPEILAARLKEYFMKPQTGRRKDTEKLAGSDLRKCATKSLAQRLHFMIFWRSQFSGLDPMVVYVVPDNFCSAQNRIRLHFIVNCQHHLRLAAVVSEESTRTKELVLFVVEWAKRRALVNITKGHAHPYAWCLMALHFLRFEARESPSLMDTIRAFVKHLIVTLNNEDGRVEMCFTSGSIAGGTDEVSKPCNLPYIEDPKDNSQNVADTLTADGLTRVREELSRADAILSREDASLSELFERYWGPVAPPSEM